jgi:adenylosuccinate synthase
MRRVGHFDASLVKAAIACNNPTMIVLNHLDYIGSNLTGSRECEAATHFVVTIETAIGRSVKFLGFSPKSISRRSELV